jgi:hypothetical protein
VEAIVVTPPFLLIWLKLKSQRSLLVLVCVVVGFQLVLGQTSSAVLAEREPPLSIAVQRVGDDALSHELVDDLASVANLEVIEADPTLKPDEVFRAHRVQGLLLIPEDFGALIEAGRRSPVTLYTAPGILNDSFAREQVANTVTKLRARHDLAYALEKLGADPSLASDTNTADLLDVVYEGPALTSGTQGSTRQVILAHGLSALLILLAYPHAALTVPTREDKRLLVHGRRAFIQQLGASLLVVWLVWLAISVLYLVLMAALLGAAFDPFSCLGFFAIVLYASSLAALLAQFLGRHMASWVFLPLFLLNMTIGGGLWGELTLSPLLSPLVPVAAVALSGGSTLLGSGMLLGATVLLLAALATVVWLRRSPTGNSPDGHNALTQRAR